jgi:hypothetical protein
MCHMQATEEEVLEVLERVLVYNNSAPMTKHYSITAVVKLSTRFHGTNSQLYVFWNIIYVTAL